MIVEGEKERQGDFVFTATEVGEYRFCFDNSVSTFSDKLVDFEITVSFWVGVEPVARHTLNRYTSGRKRSTGVFTAKSRRVDRTIVRRRRDSGQTFWSDLKPREAAEVFPDTRKQEHEHC